MVSFPAFLVQHVELSLIQRLGNEAVLLEELLIAMETMMDRMPRLLSEYQIVIPLATIQNNHYNHMARCNCML